MGQGEIIKNIWSRWIQADLRDGEKKLLIGVRRDPDFKQLPLPALTHCYTLPAPSHRSSWVIHRHYLTSTLC